MLTNFDKFNMADHTEGAKNFIKLQNNQSY